MPKLGLLRFFLIFVLGFAGLAISTQAKAESSPPPNPVWWTIVAAGQWGSAPTPDEACRLQHSIYNPGAPYLPPNKVNENTYTCSWIPAQYPGGGGNTILPTYVDQYCPADFYARGKMCRSKKVEAPQTCGGGAVPSGPRTEVRGDPCIINTGHQIENETDYATADGKLSVDRHYTSNPMNPDSVGYFGFGSTWSGLIPGRLGMYGVSGEALRYNSGNGSGTNFFTPANAGDPNNWTWQHTSYTSHRMSMVATPSVSRAQFINDPAVLNGPGEMKMQMDDGEHILFRRAGVSVGGGRFLVPVERGFAGGYKIFYDYPDTEYYPNIIRDTDGRQMALAWKAAPPPTSNEYYADQTYKVIEKIVLPDATELHYTYDQANTTITGAYTSTGGNTVTIVLPGAKDRLKSVRRTTATGTVLWGRDYLYENGRFPYALTGTKDIAGNRLTTVTYNPAGLVGSNEMANGVFKHNITSTRIDNNTVQREVTNPLGRTDRYTLLWHVGGGLDDIAPAITQIEGLATSTVPADLRQFTYQSSGGYIDYYLTSETDANNVRTDYTVDPGPWRRPDAITEAVGQPEQRQTQITYWPDRNLPESITRGNLRINYAYSTVGQVLAESQTDLTTQTVPYATGGQVRTTTYAWNPNGRLDSINGPLPVNAQSHDDITSFTYDTAGNLLTATNALGHVSIFSNYDANGRPGQMTDPNGIVTAFAYDLLGRLTSMNVKHPTTPADDAITSFEYDAEGRVTGITRPATDKLIMDYDLNGRLTAVRAASGERIDFSYNDMGGITAQTVKRSDGSTARSIMRTFDSLNRMLTETLGAGRTTSWAYDKEGNPTQIISPRNNATNMAFDGLNRLVTTALPGGGAEAQAYTSQDDVSSNIDAVSVATTYVRNGFGEVIQEVSPDRGTSIYYYDAAGRVSAAIDGRGQRIDYARDILGRVVSKTPVGRPASEVVSYTWDVPGFGASYNVGRISAVTDNGGSLTRFKYDHRGNLTGLQQAVGSTSNAKLLYVYDLADRITQIIYPSGRLVGYVRDSKGRVATIQTKDSAATATWTTVANGLAYEAFGSLSQVQLGNGLTMNNQWDNGRLVKKRLKTSTSVNRSLLTYIYDNDDNITGISDGVTPANSVTYDYDVRGRLSRGTAAATSGAIYKREDYLHDANGNRTSVERRINATDASPAQTDSYSKTPGTNRLANVTGFAGTRSFTYDNRGNPTAETRPGSINVAIAYDGHGRLTSYGRTGEAAQTNVYNGLDQRVTITSGSTARRFFYDPDGRVIGEYGTSATDMIAERIWLTPEVNDAGMFGGDDGTGGYAPIAIVTGSGGGTTLSWVHGNHLGVPILYTGASGAVTTTPAYTLPGFPGQFRTFADLYYNQYRDYDPTTGRYIQADPIGLAGGPTPYSYAMNNPLRYTDPTGQCPMCIIIPLGLIGGGIVIHEWWNHNVVPPGYRTPICLMGGRHEGAYGGVRTRSIPVVVNNKGEGDRCVDGWLYERDVYCPQTFAGDWGAIRRCRDRANDRLQACKREGRWPPSGPGRWTIFDEYNLR